ncbi:hypothetical protein [Tardiphaga sp. vice278]|uniref:hypothetical protein n=1 Tax=Tardiphaga sp. vice278 TaxID=2592815 RepID=UPI0011646FB6|nr:hypothetical protein [Tardiphaga sp. vice278]QDM17982.1 hypothetical protein FNL53_20020 [Tardiphaga sp. vice278]
MPKNSKLWALIATVVTILSFSAPAHAQATRTWVSGVGDDANPCSRTAPCKTFAGAISKTLAGGEISVLDPGGYGSVTITKSISIVQDSSGEAGILASGVNGITVNAAATDIVNLRGLVIDGAPPTAPGLNGIRFLSGAVLNVQNSVIKNFTTVSATGIIFSPSASAKLTVRDTIISNNGSGTAGDAILIRPTGSAFVSATLTRVTMDNNANGLVADSTATTGALLITVLDSSVNANNGVGFSLVGNGGAAQSFMALDRAAAANNTTGISATGSNSSILISNSTVTGNNTGLTTVSSEKTISYLNNVFIGNLAGGSPSLTQSGQ